MVDRNDQDLTARDVRSEVDDGPLEIHPAVDRFIAAVDTLVDQHVTDDVVESRLEQVRRDAARTATGPLAPSKFQATEPQSFAEELARYGYRMVLTWVRVVRTWTRAVVVVGQPPAGLSDVDLDELAKETVARAIYSLRHDVAQPRSGWPPEGTAELKTAFLTQCVRQLPHAYRSTLLKAGKLMPVDELEEMSQSHGLPIVWALRHCVTDRRVETGRLLRAWSETDADSDEILALTCRALDRAAEIYPDGLGEQAP